MKQRFIPAFKPKTVRAVNGELAIEIGENPVILVTDKANTLKPKSSEQIAAESPFGFHPAKVKVGANGYIFAKDIGIKWDRCGLYFMWCLVQKDIDSEVYTWNQYDRYFRDLPQGIFPVKNITVAHANAINGRAYLPPGKKGIDNLWDYCKSGSYLPTDIEKYKAFVQAAVERYDGDGFKDMPGLTTPCKYWQVANEPPRGLKDYPTLVKITHEAIKEADPSAKVLIGGAVYGARWSMFDTEFVPLLKSLNGKYFDIFDLHWFRTAGDYHTIENIWKKIRSVLTDCGAASDMPIWLTEVGTYCNTPKRLPAQSEILQAAEMLKRYTLLLSLGAEKIFWAWGMLEGFKDNSDNDFFDNTGFVYDGIGPGDRGRGKKKIIYYSMKQLIRLTEGAYWENTCRIDLGKNVYCVRFEKPGQSVYVIWDSSSDCDDESHN